MKDTQRLTLFAFITAWQTQPTSDPSTLQTLDAILADLETRVSELHDLAKQNPDLKPNYEQARRELAATAAERGLGIDDLPDPPTNQIPTLENVTPVNQRDRNNLNEVINRINQKLTQLRQTSP